MMPDRSSFGSDVVAPKQHRILIADDDPAIVRALSTHCAKMGFAIDTANNGMQMLLKARRTSPDLMIVDVNMPKLDGLTASLHLLEPGGHPMDVIVVTGSSNEETIQRCDAMGMFYARKGSTFWDDIDSALSEVFPEMAKSIAAHSGSPTPKTAAVPSRPRVLIVDDDEETTLFLGSRLKKLGIETLSATDVASALRLAQNHHPSVVITDYSMPGGDAEFLIKRLRSVPQTVNVPIIVLSEKEIDRATERALKSEVLGYAGAVNIFRKSFDVSELFQAIREYCAFEPRVGVES
jgi:CheY-like chemotaxis protein